MYIFKEIITKIIKKLLKDNLVINNIYKLIGFFFAILGVKPGITNVT